MQSYSIETDDSTLIGSILEEGCDDSRRILYEKHVRTVYRKCRGYGGINHHEAEDLVQEIFIKVFLNLSSLEEREKFSGWLGVITRNQCLELLKTKLRTTLAHQGFTREYELHLEEPDSYKMREAELQIVGKLIESVEDQSMRETVELFYVRGLSCQAIAESQGLSVTAVTTRLSRFRTKVQRELMRMIIELRERYGK